MDDKPQVSHQQSVGALKPFWSATFGEESKEDPFESLYQQPRAKSSQAVFGDSTNMNTGTLCSGSSSAPVTGLVGTVHQDPEGHPSLDKLTSLPTSSSSSLIERPPLSPVLPLPTNSLTNATMTSNQYLPYVHSFPHLPTNAAEDLMPFQGSSVPQFNTNAETQSPAEPSDHTGGLTMKERPVSPPVPNSQPRTEEMSTTEKEYLLQSKDWRHMRGVGLLEGEQSLSSSLNQSMSSLLDSQEDVAQQSPVTILPPAPEATPQPPSTTPQPSQQFPTSKQAGNLAQDQARQLEGNETESERTTPMLTNAGPGNQHFLPPLHNSFLPSGVSPLPHTVSVSHPPPLHTSPHLVSSENPMYSVAPTNYLNTTSETPPQVEVPREEFPGSVPLVSSAPPLQVPVASSASRPPMQPSFQPPPAQPQPLLQQPNTSSVLPPPSLPTSQATVLPQGGVQPTQVSSVLPPPSEIYASPFQFHLPASQERTNADTLQPTFQDGAPLSVQPPPSQQSELQYPAASLQPPQPLDGGHNPTEHSRGEGGPVLNTAPPDSSQVQTAQQVSAPPPPPSLLPPPTQDPLSNAPSNAGLLLSQQSIPSNAHPLSQQPPLQSVPSNAQQHLPEVVPGVLSNAHPPPTEASMGVQGVQGTQPNTYQPTSEPNAQGVLSNAYPTQSLPRSLVTGVHPPPATTSHHAPSDNIGTQPQHLSSTANTAGIVTPALSNKPPHPLNVPLHQQSIKGNLPSTPDSVFSHPTTEAPQVASNVVTGLSTAASALPANPYHQAGPVFSAVAPKVHLTQTQAALQTQANVGPVTVSTSLPQAPGFPQLTANARPLGVSETPQVTPGLVHTSGVGVGKANMPSVPSLPPQPIPGSVTNTSLQQPSLVAASSSVVVSGPPRPAVTAPVPLQEQRASAVDHRHSGGQRHSHSSVSHQPPLSSSSSGVPPPSSHHQPHHGTAEHPMHHPHPGYRGRGDGRPWRHTTDLRQRERYDPYYDEDPYEYERPGHYYEDPYYRDYYRPRPGSRAPHMYYPDPYEHDPYGSYYTEYDPYTGKYYYVEDPYVYQSDYDAYHRGYYGHPREVVPGQSQHMMRQGDPHRHTREHTQEQPINHDPGAPYPDQSTIDGPGGVFEEGGTFYASPDARRGHGVQPYHPEGGNLHHLYPESSQYGTEPPVQPDWGPSEPPVESQPPEPPIFVRNTPEKFACPHVRASFAPGGTLVVVLPHNLRAFQRAEVELSHVTELVSDSVHSNFVRAVSEFPGPLMPGETPKSVAISYATRQAEQCRTKKQAGEENEEDEVVLKELDDETLLWEFLVLLCQQNGVVVANDISELLTRKKSTVIPTRSHVGTGDQEDALENIRQLLISGRKRDALELACSRCLWGHALMLASGMDEQSRTYVINRFTASLVTTDPLSTFYTLMLGRTPSAVKPEGLRRAGSWRPHLAMILANRTNRLDNTSIVTLGDSLLESGHLCAAHFCYHLADIPFGPYGSTTSKYLLLGTGNGELAMGAFPHPEHLRKMEVFEYAMSLGKMEYVLPHFQVFKFLLALQLTQFGMVAMAFKYCEQIAAFIGKSPGKFPSTLLHVLDELSTQLHHLNHPHGVVETELPSWLLQLQQISTDVMAGNYNSSARSTPSPTFSSVSQAYGQGRHNAFMGQSRNQFLKVPGSSYKASSVDSSTATSSKEGSVVGGGLPPMPPVAQQDSYQPSNLLVSQQPGLELVQGEGHDQPEEVPYSQSTQQPPASEETVPVVSGAEGTTTYYTTQGQVPYSDTYSATAGPSSSEGGMNYGISQAPPSSEQYPAPVGSSGEFGVTTTAVGNVEPQPAPSYDQPMYGQASDVQPQQWQNYPAMEGQHYQGGQEQPPQFGYGQPAVDATQSGMFQPNLQPPSQPGYSGGAMWDQQYTGQTPAETVFSSSGATGDRNTCATAGDTNREEREARKEEEEKEENKDGESKKDDKKPAAEQSSSGGILSLIMKPFRRSGPPKARLPSDKEPRIVWDKEKNKWVDLDAGEEDEQELAPPPTDSKLTSLRQQQTDSTDGGEPPAVGPQPPGPSVTAPPSVTNAYSRQASGRKGVRSKYVDVMNPGGKTVGGASTQAPPPAMAPPPMMSGSGAPPSFFIPQQPSFPDGGRAQPAVADTSVEPVATSHSHPPPHQPPSNAVEAMGAPPSSMVEPPVQTAPPPPPHDHHHTAAGNVPPPVSQPQPPPSSQPAMPQFFNPSAFAPMSSMTGPQPDSLDDTRSTVSEMSQEVSRINSHQMLPASRPPVTSHIASYNRLRHGRRVAYPQPPQPTGPPPRHK